MLGSDHRAVLVRWRCPGRQEVNIRALMRPPTAAAAVTGVSTNRRGQKILLVDGWEASEEESSQLPRPTTPARWQ